jgi:steroid delta-isomerase-like uncharacterized protein
MKLQLAFTVLLFLSLCDKATAQYGAPPGKQLVQDAFAAWNTHDPDKVTAFYTDDIVYEDVTYGMVARGHAEMWKLAANFFAAVPDLKLEIVKSTRDKNRGSIEWILSGTDVGLYKTGKKFSVRGVSVFEIRKGKFSANRDYYDSATIMRQIGLLPAATSETK